MSQDQSSTSKSTSLKHWTDILRQWEKKSLQYQKEKAQTTDPSQQQDLQDGINACQDVILTCQGLIQTLKQTRTPPSASPTVSPSFTPIPATTQNLASSLSPPKTPISTAKTQATPKVEASPALKSTSIWRQRLLRAGLPILIVLAACGVIFRPRNICKIAPDGTHSSEGLAQWVEQTFAQNSTDPNGLDTVFVAQFGCTVVLRGTVSSPKALTELVTLAETLEVPSQAPIERLKRQLGWGSSQLVKPVEEVVTELQVSPSQP